MVKKVPKEECGVTVRITSLLHVSEFGTRINRVITSFFLELGSTRHLLLGLGDPGDYLCPLVAGPRP